MIKAYFKKDDNIITNIRIEGHAMYDDYGKDIVCAGVSTSLIVTVNAILKFDKEAIKYDNNGVFTLENIKKDEITNKLLDNLLDSLKELSSTYKDNINVKED